MISLSCPHCSKTVVDIATPLGPIASAADFSALFSSDNMSKYFVCDGCAQVSLVQIEGDTLTARKLTDKEWEDVPMSTLQGLSYIKAMLVRRIAKWN